MKFFSLFLLLSFASHAMAEGFECTSDNLDRPTRKITVARGGLPDTLTVQLGDKTVYQAIPVVESVRPDRIVYQSPEFENRNNAPASLYVQIYRHGDKLLFSFSETSYLPIVSSFGGECRPLPL